MRSGLDPVLFHVVVLTAAYAVFLPRFTLLFFVYAWSLAVAAVSGLRHQRTISVRSPMRPFWGGRLVVALGLDLADPAFTAVH